MVDRTDEETAELIREWLQQNGLSIIAGIVLGVGLLFGYQWWQESKVNRQSAQSAKVETLNQALEQQQYERVLTLAADIEADDGDIAALTGLLAAKAAIELDQPDTAIAYLQAGTKASDELLAQTAAYRLAEIYTEQEDYANALSYIQGLQGSAYQGQAALLEGYIYQTQQQHEKALEAYKRSQQWLPSVESETFIKTIESKLLVQSESS